MTAPPDVPLSKGMMLIAAYREARLRQRPTLRTSLHESHLARKAAPCQEQAAGEPAHALAAEPPAAAASPEAVEPASVFASLVSLAVSEKRTETTEAADDTAPPATQDAVADVAAVTPPDDAAATPPEAGEPARHDPPLAEIGFGPGMLIRLSQLGLRTIGDLAHADANDLRAALGDISRLVDVEAWIASARMTAPTAPEDVAATAEVHA